MYKKPVNNGVNYQAQLVNAGFLNHQQYVLPGSFTAPSLKKICHPQRKVIFKPWRGYLKLRGCSKSQLGYKTIVYNSKREYVWYEITWWSEHPDPRFRLGILYEDCFGFTKFGVNCEDLLALGHCLGPLRIGCFNPCEQYVQVQKRGIEKTPSRIGSISTKLRATYLLKSPPSKLGGKLAKYPGTSNLELQSGWSKHLPFNSSSSKILGG